MELDQDLKYLFAEWLNQEYKIRSERGHKTASTLFRATQSVKNCKEPLTNPDQLTKLKFIGDKLAKLMAKRLQEYCNANGYKYPETEVKELKEDKKRKAADPEKPRKKRKYVPAKNTGGYGILLVLYNHDKERQGMTKNEIIRLAAPYCKASFTANPGTGQFYSAWTSVNTLMNNEYVMAQGRPTYYYLTDEGEKVARVLNEVTGALNESMIEDQSQVAAKSLGASSQFHDVNYRIWTHDSYDVVFVSDNREVRSKADRDFFPTQLRALGVNTEVRALSVGDGVWVAVHRDSGQWATLDFIFERKRLDDLVGSIKDGRFREQKARLEHTGLKRIMYVVEEQMASDVSRYSEALQTSMSMAITFSNFHLQRTKDSDDTVQLVKSLDEKVKAYYDGKDLVVMEPRNLASQQDYHEALDLFRNKFDQEVVYNFETFQGVMNKSKMTNVGEIFVRLLMTVKGVSLDKAIEIQQHFKTPHGLIDHYKTYTESKEDMIHQIFKQELGRRKIGPALSKKIYEVWGK